MHSRDLLCSVFNEEMAADMLQLHQHEDGADALEGYQETVAGIYAAHATLKARAMLLRDPSSDLYITRGMYESQTLGSFRGMTAEECRRGLCGSFSAVTMRTQPSAIPVRRIASMPDTAKAARAAALVWGIGEGWMIGRSPSKAAPKTSVLHAAPRHTRLRKLISAALLLA